MRTRLLLILPTVVLLLGVGCRKEEAEDPQDPATPFVPTPYVLDVPANLPPMPIPADNPLTVEGVKLGRYLFYEERLSGNNTMSCASCHSAAYAFTDSGRAVSTGIDGIAGTRSSMALINLGYAQSFFWDGRAATLEDQILRPVRDPIEMHETWPNAMAKLQADPAYVQLFGEAFGSGNIDSLKAAKAIAQFLRTLVSANSKYDKVKRGEAAFTPDEAAGYTLFQAEGGAPGEQIFLPGGGFVVGQGGADCFHCHNDAAGLFTDEQFRNNGVQETPYADHGRMVVTADPMDDGKFKVPTLRNIMLTAPYMHDGRFATIEEVIDHYNDGGHPGSTVDAFMKFTDPDLTLGLTPEKKAQLIAFLNALTDMDFVNDERFSDPGTP